MFVQGRGREAIGHDPVGLIRRGYGALTPAGMDSRQEEGLHHKGTATTLVGAGSTAGSSLFGRGYHFDGAEGLNIDLGSILSVPIYTTWTLLLTGRYDGPDAAFSALAGFGAGAVNKNPFAAIHYKHNDTAEHYFDWTDGTGLYRWKIPVADPVRSARDGMSLALRKKAGERQIFYNGVNGPLGGGDVAPFVYTGDKFTVGTVPSAFLPWQGEINLALLVPQYLSNNECLRFSADPMTYLYGRAN